MQSFRTAAHPADATTNSSACPSANSGSNPDASANAAPSFSASSAGSNSAPGPYDIVGDYLSPGCGHSWN